MCLPRPASEFRWARPLGWDEGSTRGHPHMGVPMKRDLLGRSGTVMPRPLDDALLTFDTPSRNYDLAKEPDINMYEVDAGRGRQDAHAHRGCGALSSFP